MKIQVPNNSCWIKFNVDYMDESADRADSRHILSNIESAAADKKNFEQNTDNIQI